MQSLIDNTYNQTLIDRDTTSDNFLKDNNYWAIKKAEIVKQLKTEYATDPMKMYNKNVIKNTQKEFGEQGKLAKAYKGFKDNFDVESIPFIGSIAEGNKNKKLNIINAKAYLQGYDSLSNDEKVEFQKEINQLIKDKVYGDNFWYKLGEMIPNNTKYVIEYGLTEGLANLIMPGAGMVATSVIQSLDPTALYKNYWARQLAGDLIITDDGNVFFGELEKDPVKTLAKSFADEFATNFSEKFGDVFIASAPVQAISRNLTGWQKKLFDLAFVGNGVSEKGFKGGLQQLFNGLVPEFAEEWLEQPLRQILGANENEYNLENFVKSFGMTWDEFLLTNASIIIQGGLSNASLHLLNKLKGNKNLSNSDITSYLETRTPAQQKEDLRKLQLVETQAEKKAYKEWQKEQKDVLIKAGNTEKQADTQLKAFDIAISDMAANYLDTPISRINFLNNDKFELQYKSGKKTKTDLVEEINKNINPYFLAEYKKDKLSEKDLIKIYDDIYKNPYIDYKNGKSLIDFLIEEGGIYASNKDIKALKEKAKDLIKENKTNADNKSLNIRDQFKRAVEAGYFPEIGDYRNVDSSKTLLKAINEEINNENVRYNKSKYNNAYKIEKEYIKQLEEYSGIEFNKLKLLKELAEKKTLKQEKKDILDNNNIYYQLAYHGSPYSFDKFTLDHIGSGEGAQAHGWGLYFTLDKKVAEKYKRNLTREKQDVPTIDKELYYNGRKLNKNEKLPYVILYNISSKTKKEKEKFLKNNIEFETGEIKKASQYILDNDLLETFNKNKLKTNKESLYQVEIPNDDVMLFEYKTFKGQPEKVKESLKRIFEKNKMIEGYLPYDMYLKYKDNGFDYTKFNGDEIYKIIQTFFDGDLSERKKQASKLLNEYGIKGIRYYGAQDGECAVVFNDKSIDILNILEQRNNNSQPLGEYNPATHIATLFEGSNFSTPIHEFAHWWRQTINKFAEAGSERAQKDLDILNDFVGAVEGETWNTKKEEMFARSLENYLLRGEAPTEETKGLFKRIKEFMSDVYKSIKQLDVNLSPEMIHFFDSVFSQEMRSSNTSNVATINTYADLKDEIEKERKLLYQDGISEEKASEIINEKYGDKLRRIEEELSQLTAQDYNFDDYLKAKEQYNKQNGLGSQIENKYNSLTDFLNSAIISTNQNIREISEKVYMKYLNIDFAVNQNIKNLNKELEGFNKGILDLKKNHQVDYERVSVAWYNNDLKTIEEITKNYGFSTEFAKVRDVLERLYKQQVEAGVKVGYRENYLPTKIQPGKLKALLNEIANVYGTKVRSEIEKEAIKRGIIVESPEGLSFVNNYIRQTPSLGFGTSFTKERRLERNPIFYNYYQNFEQTLSDYIYQSTRKIEQNKFFGKSSLENQKDLNKLERLEKQLKNTENESKKKELRTEIEILRRKIEKTNDNLQSSIGRFIAEELPNLNSESANKLQTYLSSAFNNKPTPKAIGSLNSLSGLYVLPNFKSVLKQITELASSIRDFGINKTITALFNKNLIDVADLGLEEKKLTPNKLSNIYTEALRKTGFLRADILGKNTYLNAAFLYIQEKIKQKDKKTLNNLKMMFEEKAQEVKQKFLDGKAKDYDVMSYLFYLINDAQPLSSGSKTKFYNDHPAWRFAYSLKSYLIQQISFMKNKIVNEALNGNIKEATKNLLNLQLSLWLTGVPISVIGKILFDDDDDETLMEMIGESMIDNIVLNNIISRYNLAYLTTGRISDMFVNFVMPASSRAIDSLTRDIIDIIKGDFEGSKLIKNNSLYKQTINLIEKFN